MSKGTQAAQSARYAAWKLAKVGYREGDRTIYITNADLIERLLKQDYFQAVLVSVDQARRTKAASAIENTMRSSAWRNNWKESDDHITKLKEIRDTAMRERYVMASPTGSFIEIAKFGYDYAKELNAPDYVCPRCNNATIKIRTGIFSNQPTWVCPDCHDAIKVSM